MIQSINAPSSLYLWDRRTLYVGEYPEKNPLAPGASSLIVGIDGPITITQCKTNETIEGSSFLISAGVPFVLDTCGQRMSMLYLDPFNEDFFRLKQTMQRKEGGIFVGNKKELAFMATMEKILCQKLTQNEAYCLLDMTVFPTKAESPRQAKTDPRVVEVIGIIKDDPVSNCTNSTLAKRINISEVTLQRLFKATTGIPIRRFRLWHRLFVTATLMASGQCITDAAGNAGFSDSSHFNHVFKDMLGMSPSSIIRRTNNMGIYADDATIIRQLSMARMLTA